MVIPVLLAAVVGDSGGVPTLRRLRGTEAFCRKRGMPEQAGIRAGTGVGGGMGDASGSRDS